MKDTSSFFEDMSRLAGGAFDTALRFKQEMERMIKEQLEQWCAKCNLVSREEFEVVSAMAKKAREENLELLKRVEALEGRK